MKSLPESSYVLLGRSVPSPGVLHVVGVCSLRNLAEEARARRSRRAAGECGLDRSGETDAGGGPRRGTAPPPLPAPLMCAADTQNPRTTAVTFILSSHRLVTVRYDEPKPFMLVENKLARTCAPGVTGETVLMELLDAVIDRNADILERAGGDMDTISHDIFEPEGAARTGHAKRYSDILISIGRKGDLTSKVRESLVSIGRVVTFVTAAVDVKWSKDMREQLKTMQRDVVSLTDHASYLSNKITFVLDAMLGVVNLEQNNIIKLFSVMAVVLMPPTLIASIYGMNFKLMPELQWEHGYIYALVAMLCAAIGPYVYFKWKKWL